MSASSLKPLHVLIYTSVRRLLDVAGALLLLLITSPFLALIALAIKAEDRGPILFRQRRVGLCGLTFTMLKFRTLHQGRHDPNQPQRVATRIGAVLRRYGLDEVPQLWNVLLGEMSLIGPRPILPEEARHYDQWQAQRLLVLPGLTGWAQVNGRNALAWYERIERDVWYVQHQSLWLDLWILWQTPRVLLTGAGAYGAGNVNPGAKEFAVYRARYRCLPRLNSALPDVIVPNKAVVHTH